MVKDIVNVPHTIVLVLILRRKFSAPIVKQLSALVMISDLAKDAIS